MSGIEKFTKVDIPGDADSHEIPFTVSEVVTPANMAETIPQLYQTYRPEAGQEPLIEQYCRLSESLPNEMLIQQINDSLSRLGSAGDVQLGDMRDVRFTLVAAVTLLRRRLGEV